MILCVVPTMYDGQRLPAAGSVPVNFTSWKRADPKSASVEMIVVPSPGLSVIHSADVAGPS